MRLPKAIDSYPKSFESLEKLEERRINILESNLTIVNKISLLLNTKILGVLPFAHLLVMHLLLQIYLKVVLN